MKEAEVGAFVKATDRRGYLQLRECAWECGGDADKALGIVISDVSLRLAKMRLFF